MTLEINNSFTIYSNLLKTQISHWTLKIFVLVGIITTLALNWDTELERVKFFSIPIGKLGEEKIYALQDAFFDMFIIGWILSLLFYIKPLILSKVTNSFTISNSLWLKFMPITSMTKAISRVFAIIIPTLLITLLSIFWACFFSIYHNVPIKLLIPAISSLTSFSLFTGGLILLYKGHPNTNLQFRQAVVVLVLCVPLIIFIFRKILIEISPYFVPFCAPYTSDIIGKTTTVGTISSFVLGISLLILHILISKFKNLKISTNEKIK